MKTCTWKRESGYVSVILFNNRNSAAVSTKKYATKKGAESANQRVKKLCGDNWERQDLPWQSTNPETGEATRHYHRENLKSI